MHREGAFHATLTNPSPQRSNKTRLDSSQNVTALTEKLFINIDVDLEPWLHTGITKEMVEHTYCSVSKQRCGQARQASTESIYLFLDPPVLQARRLLHKISLSKAASSANVTVWIVGRSPTREQHVLSIELEGA